MFKAYNFRMYPTEGQKILIEKHIGSCRFVWNHFLGMRNKRYTETGKDMAYKEMPKQLTMLKTSEEYPWLNEINAQSLQGVLLNLDSAFHRFFKKPGGYPDFKKKKNSGSFSVPQHFTIDGNHITIPKSSAPLRMIMHREIVGDARILTVSKTPSGKYYVSILAGTGTGIPGSKGIDTNSSIGIDVGLTEFLTTSGGLQVGNPENLKESEKKLTGKKKGSRNRDKARIKVARMQEHIAQRNDFHNKISDILARQYDTIITEDLDTSGMIRNHHPAKSIADAGWSSFFSMLKTKALSRGKNVIEIGMFDPSSKMCSNCGYVYNLELGERMWTCPKCNTTHDRELNASINIKRFGLIKTGVPTDSGKFTPMDTVTSTLSLLEKEGIKQVKWLK